MHPFWIDAGVWLLVLLTGLVTALMAWLIWRDGFVRGWRASRSRPPQCPACGYNLSGLDRCRCPECGRTFRLEELWRHAVTPGRGRRRSVPAPPTDRETDAPAGWPAETP